MARIIRKVEHLVQKLPVKKQVAAYARVSSGKDAMLHSLSAQVSYYSEFIQKHREWKYVGVYSDEAMTGTKDNRAEFQRLLTDCRNGKIDMVITKSISRFARNTVTMLLTVRELKSLDVDVYFEKENIHSISGDGELMLSILASFAQEESHSVSENCKWRIRKQFQNGEPANLRFIYGYNIRKGQIEIDSGQAEVVHMIFNDYIGGMGCDLIAKKLHEAGIQTMFGGIWTAESIAAIIKNEKMTGNCLLQKKFVADHISKKEVCNNGELPKYYAQGTHSAIVDVETFQNAQEIMALNRKHYGGKNKVGHYAFTRKIICGKCGKKYKRRVKQGHIYWNCSTYVKFGKSSCQSKQIPNGILEQLSSEVLGIECFDEAEFQRRIKEIQVPEDYMLVFVFYDGSAVEKQWEHSSRSESWTDEMREQARKSGMKRLEKS